MSWENLVRKVEPYTAGEQPKDRTVIKLNTNECPYPPAPAVKTALDILRNETPDLRLYPDMDASMLVESIAACYHVNPEQVFTGVGSDDVLSMSFLTFFTNGRKILFPDITYSFYDVWADLYRIPYALVPLREDFTIDPENYIPGSTAYAGDAPCTANGGYLLEKGCGGIVFPNPNAPTGVELPLDAIERIVSANRDCVVIVDEAYIDFGAASAQALIDRYDNLLVVQTFSKSRAMAGMRIGFALGQEKLIRCLKDVKFSFNSYTMNLPSILLGTAAVKDDAYFHETTKKIVRTRERFKKQLRALGFEFPDSMTNFVFVRHPEMSGKELFLKLREKKIIVRRFDRPRIDDYLRITIGTDEQMDAVITALKEILC